MLLHACNGIGRLARLMLSDRKANFTVMAALSAPVALALAAVAIDEASIYTERREAQAMVDLAAITAASNMTNVNTAVVTTLTDNGMPGVVVQSSGQTIEPAVGKTVVTVTPGRYVASGANVGQRFQASITPYNAVRVTLKKIPARYFASSLIPTPVIGTQATASMTPQATFSVGSRLASLDGGILNALLGGLLGSNISLSVMDYNALISADVSVLSFVDGLATQLNLTGVSYSDVLASKATVGQIATAMANVPGLGNTAKAALQTIASKSTSTVQIPLSHLVDLGSVGKLGLGQRPAGLGVDASALGMLTAAAGLANGSKQVDVALGATIPGVLSTTLAIAIGEPPQSSPWLAVGEAGTVVRTAQTRIKLLVTVGVGNPNLGGGISLLSVKLPLNVEVAYAEAKLTDINCPTGPDSLKVTIAAKPGIAAVNLAASDADNSPTAFADFSNPQSFSDANIADVSLNLLLLKIPLILVKGSAGADITNVSPTNLVFNKTEIAAKTIKTTPTRDITQTLTTSLVDKLSLSVNALGILGLDVTALLGTVKPAVTTLLKTVTAPVDTLLYNLLDTLGVHLGVADVRVTGATCGRAVLVQ
ncbi:TadG family pilus assembly protein [Mesorhizobium sp. XAP10]|uniref:TadG family pilus assembly protein n=1 Tax=unclassified Mesorhizobium TaxID=325217 RepID=UPI0023E045A0|nr:MULTISPECIES: TadG family pilus assembly protein [unclassified Mesorhizobium]MDF3153336.1 TadG family pilus assembly protein [Mesorhizobium sp. XAP10]MDF3246366.1 TadG family pilus assembly protein [Mesorhizobium sp. XAP4]